MNAVVASSPLASRVRKALLSLLLLLLLLASASTLLEIFGQTYPIREWLIFRYARAWLWALVFVASSLSVGNWLVTALSPPGERLDGQLTLGFATGVYVFFLATFAAGLAGWLNQASFFAIPALLFALGARQGLITLREYRLRLRDSGERFTLGPWEAIGFAAGVIGLALVFLPTLLPDNLAYDARWYHLPLAEQYVVQGAIRRFPEGWTAGAIPHLSSILYTWAFLAPGADLFDKIMTATQLEFAVFLLTLPGIPLLVRLVLPGTRAPVAWALIFAFPSIMTYDSAPSGAADHIAALWAIPAFVMTLRALRELEPRTCLLLTIQLCGLVMSKYTAIIAVIFPVLAVLVRMPWLAWLRFQGRVPRHGWLWGPLTALAAGLLLTTPHWLKNWVWYGDPVYPMLHARLKLRPWIPDGDLLYKVFTQGNFESHGTWAERTKGALRGLYDHSFALYTWESFHGHFAVFGSLFTFSLVALPLVRAPRRLWALVLGIHLGIFVWHVQFHVDRYLQTLLPWMVAATAAIALLVWRVGLAARLGLCSLFAVQLLGGTEAIFWPIHQITSRSGIGMVNDFFARTMRSDFTSRTKPFEDFAEIGRALPKGSKVLLHREHMRLGFGVAMATDAYRIQYGLSYGYLGSPSAVYQKLREYGVTHVLWQPEQGSNEESFASNLVFHTFVSQHLVNKQNHGGRVLGELPKSAPANEGTTAFVFACDANGYQSGLYELRDLNASPLRITNEEPPPLPNPRAPLAGDGLAQLAQASYAVIQTSCSGAPSAAGFQRVASQGGFSFMSKKKP
jgi:hypothetical protein